MANVRGGHDEGQQFRPGRFYGREEGLRQRDFDRPFFLGGEEPAHRGRERNEEPRESLLERIRDLVGKGPKGYARSDERVLDDVHERLAYGYLDASEVEVSVKAGEVTLRGLVGSKADKWLAEDILEDVPGVRGLNNRLKVKQGDAPARG
jgi:hypothetical protein